MKAYLRVSKQTRQDTANLFHASGRIVALLVQANVGANHSLQGTLDDMLGVIYSLILARHFGFKDRPVGSAIDVGVIAARAHDVANGKVRLDGKWMAGFHFNSALFRLSATYHRVMKVIAGREGPIGKLLPEAQLQYRNAKHSNWQNSNIRTVHEEVNVLKHESSGVYSGRTVSFREAEAALGELIELLEACVDP